MAHSPRVRVLAFALISTSFALISTTASAFKPDKEFGHVGIVREAAMQVSHGDYSFSERAIQEMRDAVASVDDFGPGDAFWNPVAHCDDELLPECTRRLVYMRQDAIRVLKDSLDGATARQMVGQALHTLQDFYSHSNWVNIPGPGNFGAFDALGRRTVQRLPAGTETCVDDLADNILTGSGLTAITSGYFDLHIGEPPSGKCSHGKIDPLGYGIHKDKPGRPLHERARISAVAGTTDFFSIRL
jgi:von Willebrand factor A domain-containing protein 7